MKKTIRNSNLIFILLFAVSFAMALPAFGQDEKKNQKSGAGKGGKNEKQYIDLEGLDIQGLIDRPQTLYILKRSKVTFYDAIDEIDYVKQIRESTYKEPF